MRREKLKLLITLAITFILTFSIPTYAAIDMTYITPQVEPQYSSQIEEKLDKSPDFIQDNWNHYSSFIKIADTNYTSKVSYYSYTNGIHINLKDDATRSLKVQSKRKYSHFFHEVGHSIDYGLADVFMDTKEDSISNTYISKKYNCTLSQMLKKEGKAYFKKVRKKTKTNRKAWKKIDRELKEYNRTDCYELSDIWDGVSNGKARGYCGHTIAANGKNYWNNTSIGCEAFANMYEATIINPRGVKLIKKYFPKSYKIFEEEMKLTEK